MKKRRVTLNLDADVVEALESIEGSSISATANAALREAIATAAHRAALLRWLDELDADHGAAAPAERDAVEKLLEELELPSPAARSA